MKILALDAATEACSVALVAGETVHERFEIAPREHARLLLPMARELLAEAGLELNCLDAIAVGRGPGAFTGIRIAMSMAQGLALGASLPVAPVSTLAALAYRNFRLYGSRKNLVVQDARMQEVYWAAFATDASNLPQSQDVERVSAPGDLPSENFDAQWCAVGGGWAAYPEALETLQSRLGRTPQVTQPHAEDIALLAGAMLEAGQVFTAEQATPSYVRNDVAKKSGPPNTVK